METQVSTADRIISALSYGTGGFAGVIWWILSVLLLKKHVSKFLMFNIFQSMFISFTLYIVNILLSLLLGLLVMIPFINILANYVNFIITTPVFYNLSAIGLILFVTYMYLIVFSIMGKYAMLPWFSKIILYQLDRMY